MLFDSLREPIVIDGGLGTHLEARGHDLHGELWSARLLLEQPDEVRAVHDDFFAAGARVAISGSYQVSRDGLAAETLPSRDESRALIDLVCGTGVPLWLSFTVHLGALRTGESLEAAFADAEGVDEVIAVGLNCSHPSEVLGTIAAARRVTDKPIVVYPNSGEEWDAKNRVWVGDPDFPPTLVEQWVDAGASLIGGCCRVGPQGIARVASILHHH